MANLKSVLSRPNVGANYSRNPFDRSFSVNTSYQLGGLEPIFAEPCIAGSHIKLNRSIFQRTSEVNTAAFPKIDTHVEFFAVPIRLLWMYWNNYKLNIQDFNSTYQGNFDPTTNAFVPDSPKLPFFDAYNLSLDIYNVLNYYWNPSDYQSAYVSRYFDSNFIDPLVSAAGARRLMNAFGYGTMPTKLNSVPSLTGKNYMCNIFKALAYQKVYFDHFRNTAYEANDPSCYNIDRYITASELPDFLVRRIFTYRYVNYRKDYYQSIYPSLNYTVSQPSGTNWTIPDSVFYKIEVDGHIASVSPSTASGGQVSVRQSVNNGATASFTSVQQIRAAFALDKLLRASAFAPKHVKDQFEARYGVKGVENGNESVRIGAMMSDIIIQEVVSTANTAPSGDSNLGKIGGKGVGYGQPQDDIEFTCKEDSIILGLMYSIPRACYDATAISNWNAKLDREDFFIPEYMNLGLQPTTRVEFTMLGYDQAGHKVPLSVNDLNTIPGYISRYQEYKVGVDRNYGTFMDGEYYSDFTNHSNLPSMMNFVGQGVNYNFFKVKPTDLDSVFVSTTVPYDFATDHFLTHLDIKFICNQNMSVHGQPVLGGIG